MAAPSVEVEAEAQRAVVTQRVAAPPTAPRVLAAAASSSQTLPAAQLAVAPPTVIPVPPLPSLQSTVGGRMAPVVRTLAKPSPESPISFPKGTGTMSSPPKPQTPAITESRSSTNGQPAGLPRAARTVSLPIPPRASRR